VEPTSEEIVSVLSECSSQGLKAGELARRLRVRGKDLKSFRRLLDKLEAEGTVIRGRRRRYCLPDQTGHVTGRFSGYGFSRALVIPSDGSPSITVMGENFGGARHGDMVVARIVKGPEGENRAQIVKIVDRAPSETIGEVFGAGSDQLIGVDSGSRYRRVVVDRKSKVKPGDYVVVRVDTWGEPYEKAKGRVSEVLGGKLTPGEDFARIVREFNLPLDFPADVKREAEKIPSEIPAGETAGREDLRDLLTFTIDPEDAKDFDDAVSVEKIDKHRFRVGVHIADVSHFVREGSRLDNEALARARSIYLVDRVIPMLPARLSGDLASLKPEEARLTISVFMELDREGNLLGYDIRESIIRSARRLTYDEAQKLIEKRVGWRTSRTKKRISESLKYANFLAQVLKERRLRRGAIEFETSEVDIVLDAAGHAVDIKPEKRLASHNLIEELMILANETVAEHMSYLGRMFIYRVHEVPDEEDMKDLSVFAEGLGHRFRWTAAVTPHALQALLDKAKGRPEELIISMFLLRSLKKAVYSERNVGHFGLASKCYTHFTSPIRRYPDLVVHRLLKRYGLRKGAPREKEALMRFVKKASSIATAREIEGDEAERAAIKARICEFMEQRIGEEYWGTISGIVDFGFFVILNENLAEGLVHVSTLGNDYYTLDRTKTMLFGSRTGTYFRVGDRVKVRVARVDRERREVDFMLLAREGREGEEPVYVEPESRARRRKAYQKTQTSIKRARSSGRRRGRSRPKEGRDRPKTEGKKERRRRPEGKPGAKRSPRAGRREDTGRGGRQEPVTGTGETGGGRSGTGYKPKRRRPRKRRSASGRRSGTNGGPDTDKRKKEPRRERPRRPLRGEG
jgi:ribonuclease R